MLQQYVYNIIICIIIIYNIKIESMRNICRNTCVLIILCDIHYSIFNNSYLNTDSLMNVYNLY